MSRDVPFLLGHGTANDFVLLPDHDAARFGAALDPGFVAAVCDRRRGVGADGVIRVVRTESLRGAGADVPDGSAEWFMDYRNADGSVAEMCGNGIRLLVRHLVEAGLVDPARPVPVGTRSGVLPVVAEPDGTLTVDMGPPLPGLSGADVAVAFGDWTGIGTGVAVPNPHAVVAVEDPEAVPLDTVPVLSPPELYPHGGNVEVVSRVGPDHLRMRVWERGVGETMSCGTGVCAAAWVAMRDDGSPPGRPYRVDVAGGTLTVTASSDGHLHLRGPAVVLAEGQLDPGAIDGTNPR